MKSSTRKRVGLWVLLLLIGVVWWYLIAHHQMKSNYDRDRFFHNFDMSSMEREMISDMRHREKHMNDMFKDMERDFFDESERKDMEKDFFDETNRNNLDTMLSWSHEKWRFMYYENSNINWKESSYDVNWQWEEGESTGDITMQWTNINWKDFSFSWTLLDWKWSWAYTDEDWNQESVSYDALNLHEIYDDSNNIENN